MPVIVSTLFITAIFTPSLFLFIALPLHIFGNIELNLLVVAVNTFIAVSSVAFVICLIDFFLGENRPQSLTFLGVMLILLIYYGTVVQTAEEGNKFIWKWTKYSTAKPVDSAQKLDMH